MRKIIAGTSAFAACIILAGCNSGTKIIVERFPYCHNADICLERMYIYKTPDNINIIGEVQVKVLNVPKHLEVYAELLYKDHGTWTLEDSKRWGLHSLPRKGTIGYVHPLLQVFCNYRGQFAIRLHVITISSSGLHEHFFQGWPGDKSRTRLHKFWTSQESQLPQGSWPIRCF